MKNLSLIAILIILCLYVSSCTKKECQFSGEYNFTIPATLSPAQEIYNIGDTITFTSTFGHTLYDKKTEQSYQLKDIRFSPGLIIRDMADSITTASALLDFDVLVESIYDFSQRNSSSGDVIFFGQYLQKDTTYKLSYQLIPKKRGLYYFTSGSDPFEDQDFEGICRGKDIDISLDLNGEADNNTHLLEESPNSHYNHWMIQDLENRFHRFGGYCFRVK